MVVSIQDTCELLRFLPSCAVLTGAVNHPPLQTPPDVDFINAMDVAFVGTMASCFFVIRAGTVRAVVSVSARLFVVARVGDLLASQPAPLRAW